jgi:FtsZ-binding cell division protein ZapB
MPSIEVLAYLGAFGGLAGIGGVVVNLLRTIGQNRNEDVTTLTGAQSTLIKNLMEETGKLRAEYKALIAEHDQGSNVMAVQSAKIQALEAKVEALVQRMTALVLENDLLKRENEGLHREADTFRKDRDQFQREVDTFRKDRDQLQREVDTLRQQVRNLEKELDKYTKDG